MLPITCLTRSFEGKPLPFFTLDGKLATLARHLGARLGYARSGERLVTNVMGDWASEFVEGKHWVPITDARHTQGRRGRQVFWCGVPLSLSRIKKKKEGEKLGKRKGMGKARPSVRLTKERLTALLDGVVIKTRADLARHLGVSRAYVTQVLGATVHAVHAAGVDVRDGGESRAGGGGR